MAVATVGGYDNSEFSLSLWDANESDWNEEKVIDIDCCMVLLCANEYVMGAALNSEASCFWLCLVFRWRI